MPSGMSEVKQAITGEVLAAYLRKLQNHIDNAKREFSKPAWWRHCRLAALAERSP